MDGIIQAIVNALSGKVHYTIIVGLISMIPLLELRGSIIAAGMLSAIQDNILNVQIIPTYIAAVIGNMLPIPFILIFIKKIFEWMKTKKGLGRFARWMEAKALSKSDQIKKYGKFGIFLFVAIPLPGTGAWTGSLAAVLLGFKPKEAFVPILLGVMTAGLIMTLVSFGVVNLVF